MQCDTGLFELRTHGRIDAGILSGDTVSGGSRELCQPPHERTADAEDMNVH
jgi:hypothetical protein